MHHATLPADKSQWPSGVVCAPFNSLLCAWKTKTKNKAFCNMPLHNPSVWQKMSFLRHLSNCSLRGPHPNRNRNALSFDSVVFLDQMQTQLPRLPQQHHRTTWKILAVTWASTAQVLRDYSEEMYHGQISNSKTTSGVQEYLQHNLQKLALLQQMNE